MDPGWLSHFRINAQLGPQTFIIRHQLTGVQHQAHTTDLQKAELEWEIPELPPTGRPLRKTRLAAPKLKVLHRTALTQTAKAQTSGLVKNQWNLRVQTSTDPLTGL